MCHSPPSCGGDTPPGSGPGPLSPLIWSPLLARDRPSLAEPEQLLVDELGGAEASELAAEAGPLDSAERQLGAFRADRVDEDHPRVAPVRAAQRLVAVVRHHVGPQA